MFLVGVVSCQVPGHAEAKEEGFPRVMQQPNVLNQSCRRRRQFYVEKEKLNPLTRGAINYVNDTAQKVSNEWSKRS